MNNNSQALQLLMLRDDFLADIKTIRETIGDVKNRLAFNETITDFYLVVESDKKREKKLRSLIQGLLKKYRLPANFNTSIAFYIAYNVPMVPAVNVDVVPEEVEEGKATGVNIKLHSRLTENEGLWLEQKRKRIESAIFNHDLPSRHAGKLDRDIEILKKSDNRPVISEHEVIKKGKEYVATDRDVAAEFFPDDDVKDKKNAGTLRKARGRLKKKIKGDI